MIFEISSRLIQEIYSYEETAYPEESAGLLLGAVEGEVKRVTLVLPLVNSREDSARHNRYLITAQDMLRAEQEAMRLGLDVLGVFHSHPDHPNNPSEFDREWALPWFSYLITSVRAGKAAESRSWLLAEDRTKFIEETVKIGGEN